MPETATTAVSPPISIRGLAAELNTTTRELAKHVSTLVRELGGPDGVFHTVDNHTPACVLLGSAADRIRTTIGQPAADTTLDSPTPPAAATVMTAEQLDQLIDAGNKALNDYCHEDLCHCSKWPESCASTGSYFFGYWDTNAFAIALPAILAAYQAMQAGVIA